LIGIFDIDCFGVDPALTLRARGDWWLIGWFVWVLVDVIGGLGCGSFGWGAFDGGCFWVLFFVFWQMRGLKYPIESLVGGSMPLYAVIEFMT